MLLALAVVAGVVAFAQRQSAKHQATVALARELGSEAVIEPQIDVAMLLAREAVNLNRSTRDGGDAALDLAPEPGGDCHVPVPDPGATALPGDRARTARHSPSATTSASVRFFDTRTHREAHPPLTNLWVSAPPVYSKDGSLLAVLRFGGRRPPRRAHLQDPSPPETRGGDGVDSSAPSRSHRTTRQRSSRPPLRTRTGATEPPISTAGTWRPASARSFRSGPTA